MMCEDAERSWPKETGGLLIGYWSNVQRVAVITSCTGPGPLAFHAESAFRPDSSYQERELARLYAESGGHWTYLGDWHTHPDGDALLSVVDGATLRTIARSKQARCPYPIMLIVARGEEVAAWYAKVSRFALRRFQVVPMRIKPFDLRPNG
jgi:integrative and conjugative element protein (TIGR02256 family)